MLRDDPNGRKIRSVPLSKCRGSYQLPAGSAATYNLADGIRPYISPEYNYGVFLDYNKECTPGLGCAIFFHCAGANTYTGGCIAVSEENMVTILKALDTSARIIIDYIP